MHIVWTLQTKIFLYNVALFGCRMATRKEKKEEQKEDEAHVRDIAKLQIKAYKHFFNVMLMYSFVCQTYFNHVNLKIIVDNSYYKF